MESERLGIRMTGPSEDSWISTLLLGWNANDLELRHDPGCAGLGLSGAAALTVI